MPTDLQVLSEIINQANQEFREAVTKKPLQRSPFPLERVTLVYLVQIQSLMQELILANECQAKPDRARIIQLQEALPRIYDEIDKLSHLNS